jgi:hypothetical protein
LALAVTVGATTGVASVEIHDWKSKNIPGNTMISSVRHAWLQQSSKGWQERGREGWHNVPTGTPFSRVTQFLGTTIHITTSLAPGLGPQGF